MIRETIMLWLIFASAFTIPAMWLFCFLLNPFPNGYPAIWHIVIDLEAANKEVEASLVTAFAMLEERLRAVEERTST